MIASPRQIELFQSPLGMADRFHYLGAHGARARCSYQDEHGAIIFAAPSSRRLPSDWLELSRWVLLDQKGSEQWSRAWRWILHKSAATTIVSYSDPSVGHTGALYRAAGWAWAPTWHVLRPPPTGAGTRGGRSQAAKHRWVFLLRQDPRRENLLALRDPALVKRFPWAGYREPGWKRGRPQWSAEDMRRPGRWAGIAMARSVYRPTHEPAQLAAERTP